MTRVLIALGSNVGDALGSLQRATLELSRRLGHLKASPVYRTAPMYITDQPPFLNAAASGETDLGPLPLLRLLKQLETELGRSPAERYGPREIDLDLIAYGSAAYSYDADGREVLRVPHPRVVERRFVLQPLSDLSNDLVLPGLGSIGDLLEKTKDQEADVVRLEHAVLPIHGPG